MHALAAAGSALAQADPFGLAERLPGGGLGAAAFLVLWALGSLVVALLFDRFALRRARATHARWDDVVAHALRLPVFAGLLAAGVWALTSWFAAVPEPWVPWLRGAAAVAAGLAMAHGLALLAVGLVDRRAERDAQVAGMRGTLAFAARVLIWSLTLLVLLHHLGVTITPMLGAFGIGGLAVALALQDTLSNFFAGMSLRLDRPLVEGDYVELEGGWLKGRVAEVSWRSVRIRDVGGNTFHLPNNRAATTPVRTSRRSVTVPFHVQYDADLREVEQLVLQVADEVLERVERTRIGRPFVRFQGFYNEGVGVTAVLPVAPSTDQFLVAHEFVRDVFERLGEAGVSIRWLPGHVPKPPRWAAALAEDVRPGAERGAAR